MSGLAGILRRDGQPVDRAVFDCMMAGIAYRGLDGCGSWVDDGIAVGYQALHTTPQAVRERQPLLDDSGSLCLTFDGRVDNSEELAADLRERGICLRSDGDAEIVLGAYRRWGIDCAARILGDFAFVLWDRQTRRLLCARDVTGQRAFYYRADNTGFYWCSDFAALVSDAPDPNEGMVGEYLAGRITNTEETLVQGVYRLAWAHVLIVDATRIQKIRYWQIDPTRQIRYHRDEEYQEHFRDVFTKAVGSRLRSCQPVGVMLSGGLDSSSVLGMATQLISDGRVSISSIEAFGMIVPGHPADEAPHIAEAARYRNVKVHTLPPPTHQLERYIREVGRYRDLPQAPPGIHGDQLLLLAAERGFRVLLTGLGSDEWFSPTDFYYAELMRRCQFLELARHLRSAAVTVPDFPGYLYVLKHPMWAALPEGVRRVIRPVIARNGTPPWITRAWARRIALADRLRQPRPDFPGSSLIHLQIYQEAMGGWATYCSDTGNRSAAVAGVELRHPFADRRVLEFGLALPEDQRRRSGIPKFLVRRAMSDLLSPLIRDRYSSPDGSSNFPEALRAVGAERAFESMVLAELGWVDPDAVMRLYRQTLGLYQAGDDTYVRYLWPLWMTFALDLWLRVVVRRERVPACAA